MSHRRHMLRILGVMAALGLLFAAFAGAADAKRYTPRQKAQIRKQLRKQVKRSPKVVYRKSFLKKASLVNFELPVTIRLRTGDKPATATNEATTANTNRATIDLGPSLGQREIDLGGSIAGVVRFKDSYDGGALGNVDLEINPSAQNLTSTSIPLLWSSDVTAAGTRYDAGFLGLPEAAQGCGNWKDAAAGTATLPYPIAAPRIAFGPGGLPTPGGPGIPGFPVYADQNAASADAFLPVHPGIDDIDRLTAGKNPGDDFALGGNPSPFPGSASDQPGGFAQPPSVKDTVLRTGALKLAVATPGTSTSTGGVEGTQNNIIGKSGGQANLFGKIPGKQVGIDITVSLETQINSILRILNQDPFGEKLVHGDPYPAGVFNCRQVWTGAVKNFITGVRLAGDLKISPAITADGKLRIAKATVSTPTGDAARIGLAACLVPYASFQLPTASYADGISATQGDIPEAELPVDVTQQRQAPTQPCNSDPTALVKNSALPSDTVNQLGGTASSNGYSTTGNGSKVSVAGDLKVNNVQADVLIGG